MRKKIDKDLEKVILEYILLPIGDILEGSYLGGDLFEGKGAKQVKRTDKEDRRRLQIIAKHMKKERLDIYLKRFKDEIKLQEIIKEAREGNDRQLFKLLKFDKAWLSVEWVKDRIIHRQQLDDKDFFEKLSDAVRIKRISRLSAKSTAKEKIVNLINRISLQRYFVKFPTKRDYIDHCYSMVNIIVGSEVSQFTSKERDELPDIDLINDENYFRNYMRKKGLDNIKISL